MNDFLQFLSQPNQRFRCFAAGPETEERFIAKIFHTLNSPASEAELSALRDVYCVPAPVFEFYRKHNGFTLYEDELSESAGLRLAPVAEWPELNQHCEAWWKDFAKDETAEFLPEWIDSDAVVIGEVPRSGNYFLLKLVGDEAGAIFYFNHDGFEFKHFSPSISAFLKAIATDPPQLLMNLGCYASYSDGKTEKQWIAEAYAAGDVAL